MLYKYRNELTDEPYSHKINVAIVGAGQIGALLADELRYSKTSAYNPIAFIDKDASKHGGIVGGIKVYPEDDKIVDTIKKAKAKTVYINNINNSTTYKICVIDYVYTYYYYQKYFKGLKATELDYYIRDAVVSKIENGV